MEQSGQRNCIWYRARAAFTQSDWFPVYFAAASIDEAFRKADELFPNARKAVFPNGQYEPWCLQPYPS